VAAALHKLSWKEGQHYNTHTEWRRLRKILAFSDASHRAWRHLAARLRNQLKDAGIISDAPAGMDRPIIKILPGANDKLLARATDPTGIQLLARIDYCDIPANAGPYVRSSEVALRRDDTISDLRPIRAQDLFPNSPHIRVNAFTSAPTLQESPTPPQVEGGEVEEEEERFTVVLGEKKLLELLEGGHLRLSDILR